MKNIIRRKWLVVLSVALLSFVPISLGPVGVTKTSAVNIRVRGAVAFDPIFNLRCPATVYFFGTAYFQDGNPHRVQVRLYADGRLVAVANNNEATSKEIVRGRYVSTSGNPTYYQVLTAVYDTPEHASPMWYDETLTSRSEC